MYRKVILLVLAVAVVFCGSAYAEKGVMDTIRAYYGNEDITQATNFALKLEKNAIDEDLGEENPVYRISGSMAGKLTDSIGNNYLGPVSVKKELYKKVRVSFDIKVVGDDMGFAIRSRQYSNDTFSGNAGAVSLLNIPADELSDGNWHSLAMEFCADGTSDAYVVYMDDMENPYKSGTTVAAYGINFIRLQPVCVANSNLDFYLDNIVVSQEIPVPEMINVNDGEDVPYEAAEISVNLDGTLGKVTPENLVLSSIFGENKISNVTVGENSLNIVPSEKLISGTEYTLTLLPEAETQEKIAIGEEQNITFMTTAQAQDIASAWINADSVLQFSGTLVSETEISARLIMVLYDAEGRISQMKIGDEINAGIIEEEIPVSGEYTAKIFCVSSDFRDVIGEKIFTCIGGQN